MYETQSRRELPCQHTTSKFSGCALCFCLQLKLETTANFNTATLFVFGVFSHLLRVLMSMFCFSRCCKHRLGACATSCHRGWCGRSKSVVILNASGSNLANTQYFRLIPFLVALIINGLLLFDFGVSSNGEFGLGYGKLWSGTPAFPTVIL